MNDVQRHSIPHADSRWFPAAQKGVRDVSGMNSLNQGATLRKPSAPFQNGKAQWRLNVMATLKETDSIPDSALKRFSPRPRLGTGVGRHRAWQRFEGQALHTSKRRLVLRERLWRWPANDDLCDEQSA